MLLNPPKDSQQPELNPYEFSCGAIGHFALLAFKLAQLYITTVSQENPNLKICSPDGIEEIHIEYLTPERVRGRRKRFPLRDNRDQTELLTFSIEIATSSITALDIVDIGSSPRVERFHWYLDSQDGISPMNQLGKRPTSTLIEIDKILLTCLGSARPTPSSPEVFLPA